MDNKLIFSLYEKAIGNLELETVFDIINLYGNKCIGGIEINTKNLEYLEKCAMLCKKNKMLFRCHFPLEAMSENETKKYLNAVDNLSKRLRYKINIVFHSLSYQDTIEEMLDDTKEYIEKILGFVEKYKLNVYISIENLNFKNNIKRINVSKIDEILKKEKNLYFTYDIGHDIFDNKKPSNLTKLQISKINNVHIHSVDNGEDHHMIVKDTKVLFELNTALNNLKKINYNGPIVLEYSIKYLNGKKMEEKIIDFVKSFKFFKDFLLNI